MRCLELTSGKVRWSLPCRSSGLSVNLSVSRGTGLLAASLNPESAALIDVITGNVLLELRHPYGGILRSMALTSDGQRLAVLSGHHLHVWKLDVLVAEKVLSMPPFP